jgi:hypothetical protein
MSRKHNDPVPSRRPTPDDLKDWATIGLIVVSSSLLIWGPLLLG